MSDNFIYLIPEDPSYVPAPEQQCLAEARLRELAPQSDSVKSIVSNEIRLFDFCANFEHVSCPYCDALIAIDWWQEAMERDFDGTGFRLELFEMPCCGEESSLHGLNYHFPQGFGKYGLVSMNPRIGGLSSGQVAEFEKLLGCKLRLILQHI